MDITPKMVQELREKTGLGMMLCKKALTEAEGDTEKAIEILRKQGQATMEKRAGKAAKEGCVTVVAGPGATVMFEANAETDFVARNEDFVKFVQELGSLLLANLPADMDAALKLSSPAFGGQSIESKALELTGKIGEKIGFRRFHVERFDPSKERVSSYVHNKRIGILLKLACDNSAALATDSMVSLGKDLAMQVAASNPIAVSRDTVSADVLAREKDIYHVQAQNSGKPEKIWEKIVEGKLQKFYKDYCLVEQAFIRDPEVPVSKRIQDVEKELGAKIAVRSFVRYELGAEA